MEDNVKLPNGADRYTVLWRKASEISAIVEAASLLDLVWIIEPVAGSLRDVKVFIFFDNAGKRNYLSGVYDEVDEL